jgi:drug/metabolite transporter (DMT)-like permease
VTYFLLFIQQLIASSTHLVAKNITHDLHPTVVVLFRGIFTCLAYGAWVLIRRRHLVHVKRSDLPLILLLGLINLPINQLLFVWGVKFTTAPNAALAYALTPVFVVIMLALARTGEAGWKRWIGVGVALIGAVIVLVDKGARLSPDHTLGNVMVLCASASWAAYTVLGRRLIMTYGAVHATALTFFSGLGWYVLVYTFLPIDTDTSPLTEASNAGSIWLQLFYLGVITSGLGYALWYYALTHMETSKVAVFNNLQPVLTTILALIIFGTEPTIPFVIGGVIALSGVVITQRA